jgi:hypothetical protein
MSAKAKEPIGAVLDHVAGNMLINLPGPDRNNFQRAEFPGPFFVWFVG